MNCIQECPSLNIFAAGACPCHEAARTALDQTETAKRGRSGVRVTRLREKRNEGDKVTTRFVRNNTGTKIHERGCKSAAKNAIPWRWAEGKTYNEIMTAIPRGVTECGHCQPLSGLALTEAMVARFTGDTHKQLREVSDE